MASEPREAPTKAFGAARRMRWERGAAVGAVAAVAALVWFVVPPGSGADPAPATAPSTPSTTAAPSGPVTVYGCAITAGVADPGCTDASVVAEYCNVPRQSIATPGKEERTDQAVTRTYETVAGLPAGAVTHFQEGAGLPDLPVTLLCATTRTFGFTAADVDAFTSPP
jgi:hypothetical protein